jgi:hypothetical protein
MNESISILEAILISGVSLIGWVFIKTLVEHIKNK